MAEGLMTMAAAGTGTGAAAGLQRLLGGGGEEQSTGAQIQQQINMMNNKLSQSLNQSLDYTKTQTNRAINTQKNYLGQGTDALNNSLAGATNAVNNTLLGGFQQSQALQSPYAMMGYNAADAYSDSLGLARPQMGSAAMATGAANAGQINPQLVQQLQQAASAAGQNPYGQGYAPAAPAAMQSKADLIGALSPQQQALLRNTSLANQYKMAANASAGGRGGAAAEQAKRKLEVQYQQQQALQAQIAKQLAAQQKQYKTAQTQYKTQQGLFNNYSNAQNALLQQTQGMNVDQQRLAAALQGGLFNPATRI